MSSTKDKKLKNVLNNNITEASLVAVMGIFISFVIILISKYYALNSLLIATTTMLSLSLSLLIIILIYSIIIKGKKYVFDLLLLCFVFFGLMFLCLIAILITIIIFLIVNSTLVELLL